jgi:hypothetical protein
VSLTAKSIGGEATITPVIPPIRNTQPESTDVAAGADRFAW